jgi:hypothetical protein
VNNFEIKTGEGTTDKGTEYMLLLHFLRDTLSTRISGTVNFSLCDMHKDLRQITL